MGIIVTPQHYIIVDCHNDEVCKISLKKNDLKDIIKFFKISRIIKVTLA